MNLIFKKSKKNEVRRSDLIFFYILKTIAFLTILLFVSFFIFLFDASKDIFHNIGWHFFLNRDWSPSTESYGALAFIYGTLVSSLIALILAVPIGVGSAIFLTELCPKYLSRPIRFLIELLAAIPSVVYGLWGIFILVPFIRVYIHPFLKNTGLSLFEGPPFGIGLFTAGVILAIMIIPTITTISCEVFKSIPRIYREGAKALGATTWETIILAVLKQGKSGIFGAVVLGFGRAMGETMAVTMVIGNRPDISASLFSPAATMASVIANEYAEANNQLHISSLTAVGLTLLLISFIVNGLARLFTWKSSKIH